MAAYSRQGNREPYEPCKCKEDVEIPLNPTANRKLSTTRRRKSEATSGQFKDLKCVRKTRMTLVTSQASRMTQRCTLIQDVKILYFARHCHVIRLIHTSSKTRTIINFHSQ
ncbi:hypothetical protein F5884DRAFT_787015 [Xylogone sp. PMI_703]|nr:hypothetical protein F5884DRAFT_787015 [Xylogone sp. PMI_703]